MTIEGERHELMAAGDAAWTELCAVLDAAEPAMPLHDPDSPEWTSRNVYTHFLRMHAGSARAIRHELETGERYQWSGLDENDLNEQNVAEDRALVAALDDDAFERIGRRHGDDLLGGHYRGHLEYIEAAWAD